MRARVQRWGNSLALRIPHAFGRELHLAPDTPIDLTIENGRLILVPASSDVPSLDELLAQITEANLHAEIPTGPAVGGEAW